MTGARHWLLIAAERGPRVRAPGHAGIAEHAHFDWKRPRSDRHRTCPTAERAARRYRQRCGFRSADRTSDRTHRVGNRIRPLRLNSDRIRAPARDSQDTALAAADPRRRARSGQNTIRATQTCMAGTASDTYGNRQAFRYRSATRCSVTARGPLSKIERGKCSVFRTLKLNGRY